MSWYLITTINEKVISTDIYYLESQNFKDFLKANKILAYTKLSKKQAEIYDAVQDKKQPNKNITIILANGEKYPLMIDWGFEKYTIVDGDLYLDTHRIGKIVGFDI